MAGAGKAPLLQHVGVHETVERVEQQVLACWTQLSRMTLKLCVSFGLPCLTDVDCENVWKSYSSSLLSFFVT